METISVSKEVLSKILTDFETLIDDVELALDEKVRQRIADIESGRVKGKTEQELDDYLRKRGVAVG